MDDNSLMPFGKKKGEKLGDISNGYLLTLYDRQKEKLSAELIDYIEDRIPVLRSQKEKRQKGTGE